MTAEDRNKFEEETGKFLDFVYDNLTVKSIIVPGTEVPHMFRDGSHFNQIKTYLSKLTDTITTRMGAFDLEDEDTARRKPVRWESPLKYNTSKEVTLYSTLLKKGSALNE